MSDTVLVIDDQELVRAVLSRFLARNGYSVAAAGSGEQALDAITWHQPSVVIADAALLTDDGVLIEHLRRDAADVPIVLMADSPQAAEQAPIEDVTCLVKPFDVGVLLDTVVDLVGAPAYSVAD